MRQEEEEVVVVVSSRPVVVLEVDIMGLFRDPHLHGVLVRPKHRGWRLSDASQETLRTPMVVSDLGITRQPLCR